MPEGSPYKNHRRFLPVIVLGLFCVLACGKQESETATDRNSWPVPPDAAAQVNPVRYDIDSVTAGQTLFEQHCQACHGYYGEGNGVVGATLDQKPANLLRLAGREAEGAFAWKIREGHGAMPAFRNKLSDDQIWHIVNFVESLENEQGSLEVSPEGGTP